MSYLIITDLLKSPGALELSETATPDHRAPIQAELLEAVILAANTSAWAADEIAIAMEAVAVINDAMRVVAQLIDGYLRPRYSLPLASIPAYLSDVETKLVRYRLHRHLTRGAAQQHPVIRDYDDAMKMLRDIAAGKLSLGIDDPNINAAGLGGAVEFVSRPSVFANALGRI